MKPVLPQREPCEVTAPMSLSASIALLDSLLAALRSWQPRDLPPAPPTEQDVAALHSVALSSALDTVATDQRQKGSWKRE